MLPELAGEELLPNIKAIPVIVVSAKTDTADKVGLVLGGAVYYVTKPFDLEELLARITVQLRRNDNSVANVLQFDDITLYSDTYSPTALTSVRLEFASLPPNTTSLCNLTKN